MKKIMSTLLLGTFLVTFSGIGITNTYAMPSRGPQWQNHDEHWQRNHDQQWRNHKQEWRDHDREWRDHDGDRDWQRAHAHEWHDWYRWHHDNGDDGFSEFLLGTIVGVVLGSAQY
ncbi:MAG: hypothetical protein LKI76_08065 [Megasphaera sp.]|jgi:hypothetical protein|uniref:hypothetical protein n=1 Tax=Megasphaera sueciensis TaxID=349094 RepID=UPI003D047F7F|nr:hypothetical protein [Megasphaera sp.]MCI1823867.1 hypothetical protein [Megasphaera sp.]